MKKISYIKQGLWDLWEIFTNELHRIFTDRGVVLIFFVAGVLYPILYPLVYNGEILHDVPVAVVDNCDSKYTRDFTRKVDACREVNVTDHCATMDEARKLMEKREIHGIIFYPSDFQQHIANNESAHLSVYCDLSSFLLYKTVYTAVNAVLLDEMNDIQIDRYAALGKSGESGLQMVKNIPYNQVTLYPVDSGIASFMLPMILILIIHQTLVFGIGMLQGTAREENKNSSILPERLRGRGIYRVVFGKAAAYILIYMALTAYILGIVPRIFNLPHIGNIWTVFRFMFPFLLATTFFGISISIFFRKREDSMVLCLPFTIMLLFLAGVSWPYSNVPEFWKLFGWLFPSTHGIQGYVLINTTAAELPQVAHQYISLWILTGIYFISAVLSTYLIVRNDDKRLEKSRCDA